jgi:branched-chain amino acid transport system substrate-binding protein
MEDLIGRQFGHYQIVAPLGEGGMAAVYRAYQPSMERFVAVKVLPRHMASSEEFVSRFRREARLLAQLQHPHILPVFDYGEADGYPYIVMPFVQSGTLAGLLQSRRLSLQEVRRIMTQLGDALSYAHTRGMIHRDIKPSNVLIDERGNCLLTDFGLARMAESATKITTSGTVMGTPAYMSPEQGAGSPVDHRTDIYSLGIIFYESVTGRVPFQAETPIAIVFKHIQDPLPSARKFNPNLPEAVELVLLKALAKSPEDRYQKAEEFVQAIQRAIPEDMAAEESALPTYLPAAPTIVTQSALPDEKTAFAEPKSAPAAQTVKASMPEMLESEPVMAESSRPRRFPVWALAGIGAVALMVIVIVVATNAARKAAPSTTPTEIVPNTSTPTNPPPPSPTPAAAIGISPGAGFRDDFDGQLADGWTWLAEDPSKWSLSAVDGGLQITASDASLDGSALPPNILVRDVPAGDFEITTLLHFAPTSNYQIAGLIIFQDQENALQFGRAFCNTPDMCLGDGVYMDNYENGSLVGSNQKTPFRGEGIYLRLQRAGNIYSGYFSADGEAWTKTGEQVRDFSQIRVGLIAAQAPVAIPAVFDYFSINAPATITTRTDLLCRAAANDRSDVSIMLKAGMTIPVYGTSMDSHWLNVQHPEKPDVSCWIPFNPDSLNANAINVSYSCIDPLGCVQVGPRDPFQVAFWGVLSGPDSFLGQDSLRGVEIAIDDLGGKLHEHQILLTSHDALCTLQGGATATDQIAEDESTLALIGSSCSDETVGGISTLTEAGLTTISPSNTRASLTDPERGPEYAGYLRTAPNDAWQGRIVAEFVYDVLGLRRVAIIQDESSYSTALQQTFADQFTAMGGEIVARESISSGDTIMRGVLTRISAKNPDLIYYPVFAATGGHITAQVKEIPGLENVRLIASDGVFAPDFLAAAGPAAQGVFITSPDFSRFPASYGALVDKYLAKYGSPPPSSFHAHAYDAARMIFSALEKVAIVESDGTVHIPRLRLRDTLYATKDFEGVTGILTCSSTGDCGTPAFAVYEVANPDPAAWNPQDPANPNPMRIYP